MVFKVINIDKEATVDGPPVIYQPAPKPSKTKKYAIIGLSSIIIAGILMITVLVGIYLYTEAQKEIVKFSLKLDKGRSQDVTSDVSSNVVTYHVKDGNTQAWIVDDFNTDIKVTKLENNKEVNCYITPLNRSTAMEPSQVTKPNDDSVSKPSKHDSIVYQTSGRPVADMSFLSKEAQKMCKGILAYWMYPVCSKAPTENPKDKVEMMEDNPPYYSYFLLQQDGLKYPCINGCCSTVCAYNIQYTWQIMDNKIYCNWITEPCWQGKNNCFYKRYCSPTKGLACESSCG